MYLILFDGFPQARQLRGEVEGQALENEDIRAENEKMAAEVRAAKKNPANAEEQLRENYFIKDKDEVLFIPTEDEEKQQPQR